MNGMNVIWLSFFLSLSRFVSSDHSTKFLFGFFVNSGRGRIFSRGIFHWERVQSVPLPGLSPGGLDITGIAANQLSMNMNEDVRRKNRTFKKNTKYKIKIRETGLYYQTAVSAIIPPGAYIQYIFGFSILLGHHRGTHTHTPSISPERSK
jgi:hypothetical protein